MPYPRRRRSPGATEARASVAPDIPPGSVHAIIVRAYGKFYEAQVDDGRVLLATVRGVLKRERRRTDLVAVGDRVWVTDIGEGEGQIDAIEPRTRSLARLARLTEDTEQIILANPDQALFLFAVREPSPHLRMLDRFLVLAESRELPAAIGVNKMDLDGPAEDGAPSLARSLFGHYEASYPVFYLGSKSGQGLVALKAFLLGRITAVAGPSGVGKSSLLNVLDPDGQREVGIISGATGKGRHTTTATVLRRIPAPLPTYVADTPGIRALSLQGVDAAELDRHFPEFRGFLGRCFYPDCSHLHEPGCAVREATAEGRIPVERYESYAALRRGDEDR